MDEHQHIVPSGLARPLLFGAHSCGAASWKASCSASHTGCRRRRSRAPPDGRRPKDRYSRRVCPPKRSSMRSRAALYGCARSSKNRRSATSRDSMRSCSMSAHLVDIPGHRGRNKAKVRLRQRGLPKQRQQKKRSKRGLTIPFRAASHLRRAGQIRADRRKSGKIECLISRY